MEETDLDFDTSPIVAVASSPSISAIIVMRLSGRNCHELLKKCIATRNIQQHQPNMMTLCRFLDDKTKEVIDDPLIVFYNRPRSYTGEDSAEIFLHGSPYIVQTVFSILIRVGFRAAEPGEFTRRAFLNGKMDLTKAEGVHELVSSCSKQQWFAARQLMSGNLAKKIEELRVGLIEAMAFLEAKIDFPDENEVTSLQSNEIYQKVFAVRRAVEQLMDTYESGRVSSQGLSVALVGPPNAGKSTLMNTLLSKDRAIVTETPGTTRDYLEEQCSIEGRLIRLFDTAGLRESQDSIESFGIKKTKEILKQVDVVLLMVPSVLSKDEMCSLKEELKGIVDSSKVIQVITKEDLGVPLWYESDHWLSISCTKATGLINLKKRLIQQVDRHLRCLSQDVFITSYRHFSLLEETKKSLDCFLEKQHQKVYEEMLAFELQQAAKFLVNIVGVVDNDDLLDSIFSQFCIGK